MPLSPATRLGPYEILSVIGAGGMGEVYRAKDTRLDRIVAIKILPEHRHTSSQARERFVREARAISALSHPHICALCDIGHQDPPVWRFWRKVTASIRVIFIGSVLSITARVAAGSRLAPIAPSAPAPALFRKDLRLRRLLTHDHGRVRNPASILLLA